MNHLSEETIEKTVRMPATGGKLQLEGSLAIPAGARGLIIFAHGSGSSRHSPRNQMAAQALRARGMGTLLFDLLTEAEAADRANVFHIPRLAERLLDATRWSSRRPETSRLRLGYFGASTGAAAALVAAALSPVEIGAVVSRGGRPDLAWMHLHRVKAPTLLIVGGRDHEVLDLNRRAFAELRCEKEIKIVPGATHLFEEPGTMDEVIRLAGDRFEGRLDSDEEKGNH